MPLPSLEEKPVFVQSLFNRIAPRYDLLNNIISLGMHWLWKNKAVDALKLKAGQHALDVCTGTGDLLGLLLKEVGERGAVTGLDFSEAMLAVAKERYPHTPNLQVLQGDAMNLPFQANTFQASIISFGLRNVADIRQTLAEMIRCTASGGVVLNLDTVPITRFPFFAWYFKEVMPRLGQYLGGDKEAYDYLQASTEAFMTPEALKETFEALGLVEVQIQRLGLGSVAMIIGRKP
ncbi:MAG: bifunctional demethylmenaquinone methyltransferase/2-methoxy-6-polyprenyl-1,4-benzoquinol methylase UbiE [Vampirovibrio sp.]